MAKKFPRRQLRLPRFMVYLISKYIAIFTGIKDYEIAGSYRRGKFWCNDIDLLIKNNDIDFKTLDKKMRSIRFFVDRLRLKRSGASSRQYLAFIFGKIIVVDIFFCTDKDYGTVKLFTTGSASHNHRIRARLKEMGYIWQDTRCFKNLETNEIVSFSEEKDALLFLKMPYLDPKER